MHTWILYKGVFAYLGIGGKMGRMGGGKGGRLVLALKLFICDMFWGWKWTGGWMDGWMDGWMG